MRMEFHCFYRNKKGTYRALVNMDEIEEIYEDEDDSDHTVLIFSRHVGLFNRTARALIVDEPYVSVRDRILTKTLFPTETSPAQRRVFVADEIFGEL